MKKYWNELLLLLFPILLFFIHLFASEYNGLFSWQPKNMELYRFMTHSFFHQNYSHLFSNIGVYFLITALLYWCARKLNRKGVLTYIVWTTILLTPPITAFFYHYVDLLKPSLGSSNIMTAITGLVVFWIVLLGELRWKAYSLFTLAVLMLSFISMQMNLFIYFTVLMILCIGMYIFLFKMKNQHLNEIWMCMAFLGISIYFSMQLKVENGTFTNIYGHYLGFVIGLFIGWIFFLLEQHIIEKHTLHENESLSGSD